MILKQTQQDTFHAWYICTKMYRHTIRQCTNTRIVRLINCKAYREILSGFWCDDLIAVGEVLLILDVSRVDGALQTQQLAVVLRHLFINRNRRHVNHVSIGICK